MTRILVSLMLAALLGLAAGGVAAQDEAADAGRTAEQGPTGEPLSSEEVQALFTGNTETNEVMKRGVPTGRVYNAYYEADGSYRMKTKKGWIGKGVWFVDPLGRHCFRPEGKDKTKCDVIVREGDHYIRLRDGGRRGKLTIRDGNPDGI